MVDAARLADELRAEQDHTSTNQRQRDLLKLSLVSLKTSLLKQMRTQCAAAVQLWLSLKPEFASWRLSLEMFKPTPVKMPRDTKSQSVAARNLLSRSMRTRRTRTAWLSWLTSCSRRSKLTRSRLRKLRKLLP